MKQIIRYIQQRLSLQLGLLIVGIILVVFSVLFDYLFYQCKRYIKQVAIEQAEQQLDNTAEHINGIMDETEVVTNYMANVIPHRLHPDSLLAIAHRTVTNHSFLTGFAISMEPYFFPEMGRYFSAYSLRQDDTISTVREGPFEYFEKVWYKSSRTLGVPCWVDAYDDYNEGTQSSKDYLTSYCCPMRDENGKFIGSITTSLSLNWLSEAVTKIQPYPNSSAIMIGRNGTYLVHPDTAKLFRETIFSDAAPEAQRDINILGKAMIAGHSGMTQTIVDGREAYIFYRPLQRTGWSIAIVCPASDVFSRYHQLLYTVWVIIGIGLLVLLLICYLTIKKAMLTIKADDIEVHQDEAMPTLTWKADGWKNNEDESVLTTQPVCATEGKPDSPPGDYPITISGAEAANYEFTYVDGTLTISLPSGITFIDASASPADIYTLQGVKVRSKSESLDGLTDGIYIVNKRKVYIKRK